MMDICVSFYEEGRKHRLQLNEIQSKENLIKLQKTIAEREGRRYPLGELADCLFYISRWQGGKIK